MQTKIEFLQEFREDLLDAAWRESVREPNRRPRRTWSRRWIVATAAATTLVVAGVTGFVALRLTDHRGPTNLGRARFAGGMPSGANTDQLRRQQQLDSPTFSGSGGNQLGILAPTTSTTTNVSGPTAGAVGNGAAPGPVSAPADVGGSSAGSTSNLTKIVKRGDLEIEVKKGEIESSIQKATDIAGQLGGYVQSTSSFGNDTGGVVLRVPVKRFERAVGALSRLGRVTSRDVNGADVTSKFVDLKGRLMIAKGQRATLLSLLTQATTIPQTLQVQNALNNVELNIENLEGQIRVLANEAAQSTIQVGFSTPGAPVKTKTHQQVPPPIHNPSFIRGVKHAWAGFLGVIVAVLVGLGYLVPVAVLAAIVWVVVRRFRRPRSATLA